MPRLTLLKQAVTPGGILKAFIEKNSMETTAHHIQFSLTLSLITKQALQQRLLRSTPAAAPEMTPGLDANSWRRCLSRHRLCQSTDLRNTTEPTCRKRPLSTGRDRWVALVPPVAGFNSHIILETDAPADRLTAEKTERREEESERI